VIRAVVDTNGLVSAAIKPRGEAGRILSHLRNHAFTLLYSTTLLEELVDVLNRPHLREKYHLTGHYLHLFLHLIRLYGEKVEPTRHIIACRDADDDKFLEVAASGGASFIISNDEDLLVLSPFEGILVITPGDFLKLLDNQAIDK
jgi:putative PIN family toxin of toxin-antitoxin system